MTNLGDAWEWYRTAREQLRLSRRLGLKYWDAAEFRHLVDRDEQVRNYSGQQVEVSADLVLAPLADLAVLVLFSVFEATLRDDLVAQLREETAGLTHPVVRQAVRDAEDGIENGSFYNRVLSLLKGPVDSNLIEGVNQVRRYRNWVAHGRRTAQPDSVTPELAYQRLADFLAAVPRTTTGTP